MRKANSNKQTVKLRRNVKPFSSREIAVEINLFFFRVSFPFQFSFFYRAPARPPLSEIRDLKIQRRDGDENGQKTIGLKRVRFITKIQDQIKNPDHQDFSSRKETMYPKKYYFHSFSQKRPTLSTLTIKAASLLIFHCILTIISRILVWTGQMKTNLAIRYVLEK